MLWTHNKRQKTKKELYFPVSDTFPLPAPPKKPGMLKIQFNLELVDSSVRIQTFQSI